MITAVNDAVAERLETVILTLTPDAAYNIGGTGTATIIDDNDDNNNVLVRYIFTDANSIGSTFSLAAQVYSTNVSATAIAPGAGISVGTASLRFHRRTPVILIRLSPLRTKPRPSPMTITSPSRSRRPSGTALP